MTKTIRRTKQEIAASAEAIQTRLNELSAQRTTWEDGFLRVAKSELYDILSGCCAVEKQISADKALRAELSNFLKSKNIVFTAGTSIQLKVIRLVFGQTSEEHIYARALREAERQKVKPGDFAKWLKDNGGPSGIKNSAAKAKKNQDRADNIAVARGYFAASGAKATFGTVDGLQPNMKADHDYAIALVRPSSDDPTQVEVVFGINNVALLDAILAHAASQLSDDAKESVAKVPADDASLSSILAMARVTGGQA